MIRAQGANLTRALSSREARAFRMVYNGKTIQYWEAIIDKLEHGHHERVGKDGDCEPLFLHSLKVEYVKNRFDKFVSNRSAKLEQSAKRKPRSSNPSDWVSGEGDNSDNDGKSEDDGVGGSEKVHLDKRDSLLDAYFAQIRGFAEGPAVLKRALSFSAVMPPSANHLGKTKRIRMGDAANAGTKITKLPKLPKITQAEQAQSSAVEHNSRVGVQPRNV